MKNEKKSHQHNIGDKYNNRQRKQGCSPSACNSSVQQIVSVLCQSRTDSLDARAQLETPRRSYVSVKSPAKLDEHILVSMYVLALSGVGYGEDFNFRVTESADIGTSRTDWPGQSQA
jgi:hypothetical protein